MIQLKNIAKKYGSQLALEQIDLTIQRGMNGLLGPNGAGKTTLLRILTGFIQPSHGEVLINDLNMSNQHEKSQIRRDIGYIPQHIVFYPRSTVNEIMEYIARLKNLHNPKERKTAIDTSLEYVGLANERKKKTYQLSGGMKRRLAIAQAIVNDPKILIIDEPTAGLDPEERMRFRHLLAGLGSDRLVILSTHIVEDILQTCQQVMILKQQVLYTGAIKELINTVNQQHVVWDIMTHEPLNEPQYHTVAAMATDQGFSYRVVGPELPQYNHTPATAGLEEAYLWVLHHDSSTSPTGTVLSIP